ncbi:MAG TPA: TlpA disulfide reductase family protein [Candidatus Acidoferrales bacterium]|nr:TlpA disulfide reductase family protein [Candidatus Acidoferrales bacterium]
MNAAQDASDDKPAILYFAKDPEPVPPFLTQDLSGKPVSTTALRGKVILLNFWATWCGPCREEIPELIALQAQYPDQLAVIGASEDDIPPAQVAKFAQKMNINYPVIMATRQLDEEYGGIAAFPTSFLINTQGRVVQKDVGVYSFAYYNMQIRALLGLPVNARIETFEDVGQIFLKNAAHASQLPGVSFSGLTQAQKKIALHRLNAESCTCGCKFTLAQCRINDTSCPVSNSIANQIVREVAKGSTSKNVFSPKTQSEDR